MPDRPADQVDHRHGVELAGGDALDVLLEPLLGLRLAGDQVEGVVGLDELDQPVALPLDHRLLQLPERSAIDTASERVACKSTTFRLVRLSPLDMSAS